MSIAAASFADLLESALTEPGIVSRDQHVQHWNQRRGHDPIPERSAQRIFKATDRILTAGQSRPGE